MPVFTIELNGQNINLPEAATKEEALHKAGLNPEHWKEDGAGNLITNGSKERKPAKQKPSEIGTQLAFETSIKVDISLIIPNPYQPDSRLHVDEEMTGRIAASIKEHGLLQTPVVRQCPDGKYEMGDGWIRLAGYRHLFEKEKLAEYSHIPVIIRNLTDKQMADLVMEANTIRKDLTSIDLAKFYKRYLEDFKITQAELARLHNVSQGEIANTLRLLELPADIQEKIISQEISETHARYLLQLKDPKELKKVAGDVIKRGTSVVDLDREIKNRLWQKTEALYKMNDWGNENPLFAMKTCEKCEHRVMLKYPWSNAEEKKPRCDNKDCWHKKQRAAIETIHQAEIDALKKQGITNFPDKVEFKESLVEWRLKELDKPQECNSCTRRAGLPGYSGHYEIYCIDKECIEAKRKIKREADDNSQQKEAEKTAKYIEGVFTDLPINEQSLQATIECLLNAVDDDDPVLNFVKAFDLLEIRNGEDIEDQDDFIDRVMTAIKDKGPDIQTLTRMISRLSFEMINERYGYGNRDESGRLLKAFKAAHQNKGTPEKTDETTLLFDVKKIDSDFVVFDKGIIIAVATKKDVAIEDALKQFNPIATILDPKPEEYMLNHTYRISFKDHSCNDVTAQDVNVAIAATGKSPEDVTQIKVHKSSGKPSTGGGVGCGWGKCTETIEGV